MDNRRRDLGESMLESGRHRGVSLEELARQLGVPRERIERYRNVGTPGADRVPREQQADAADAPVLVHARERLDDAFARQPGADLTALRLEIEATLEARHQALMEAIRAVFDRHAKD